MRSFDLVLFPALAAASPFLNALGQRDGCDADNCLRAVRASASLSAHISDCASYLLATVTPATLTVYQTLTFSTTPTTTASFTLTTEVPETATSTVTDTVSQTSITTLTSPSSTVTETQTVVTHVYGKRQETNIPSSIPSYASACSGAVRYSSACSCVGALPSTITASAPVTTITLSVTVTPATQTVDTTVLTLSQTTTVSTTTDIILTTDVVQETVIDATPTTVTTTATTTALANDCTAGATHSGGGRFGFEWTQHCDQTCSYPSFQDVLQESTEIDFTSCIAMCDDYAVGSWVNYNYNTGDCVCWFGAIPACSAAPGFDSAVNTLN